MKSLIVYSFLVFSLGLFAQEKDKNLPEANKEYEAKNYPKAEAEYRISQSKIPGKSISKYNLGNAIYRQNQPAEAKLAYTKAIKVSKTRSEKHEAFHNLGNVYMKEKDYAQAVEAYKNALRNNPDDEETRYNYALAKKMLKENPPKEDKKDKKDKKEDKKDKKDEKKEDKKDEKKDDKKEGNKDKKENQEKKENEQGQPKPKPGGISKERLQNLLDAVNNEEKKVQEKVNAQKVKGKPVPTEKDW